MKPRIIKNLAVLRDLPEGETAKWVHPENGTTHIFEFVPSTRGCEACALDKLNHDCTHFCESAYRKDKKFGIFKELPEEAPKKTDKMELKHWAAFLPYAPEIKRNSASNEMLELSVSTLPMVISNGDKLILRPMSHLSKEIEHKGKKFVPIRYIYDKMKQRSKLSENDFNDIVCGEEGLYQYTTKSWRCLFNFEESLYLNELLKELHFDTDGLIEKGEAIAKE